MYVINRHFNDVVYKLPFLHLFFFYFGFGQEGRERWKIGRRGD